MGELKKTLTIACPFGEFNQWGFKSPLEGGIKGGCYETEVNKIQQVNGVKSRESKVEYQRSKVECLPRRERSDCTGSNVKCRIWKELSG